MGIVTAETHCDIIFEIGQDINDIDDWGFDLVLWLQEVPADSLLSVDWGVLPTGIAEAAGGSGISGTRAYIWLDTSAATAGTEYKIYGDMVTAQGRQLRGRLDMLVRDVTTAT